MPKRRKLSKEQRNAINFLYGKAFVVAAAGSGKTYCIKQRYKRLLRKGVEPQAVLLLSHTRKSAGALAYRSRGQPGLGNAFTVHGLSYLILREFPQQARVPSDFVVADVELARSLLQVAITKAEFARSSAGFSIQKLQSYITLRRSGLMSKREALQQSGLRDPGGNFLLSISMHYKAAKRAAGVLDFEDLLHFAFRLLNQYPKVLKKLRLRFRHILVDECQDLSPAQLRIVLRIFGPWKKGQKRSLLFAGDPGQSIYSFHGASYEFLRNLNSGTGTKTFPLTINYRPTKRIIALANALDTAGFEGRLPTVAAPGAALGTLPALAGVSNEKLETLALCKMIRAKRRAGIAYGSQAILLRTSSGFEALGRALTEAGIAVRVVGGKSRERVPTIASMAIDIFRAATQPDDLDLLRKVLRLGSRKMGRAAPSKNALLKRRSSLSQKEQRSVGTLLRCIKRAGDDKHPVLKRLTAITRRLRTLLVQCGDKPGQILQKGNLAHLKTLAADCADPSEFLSLYALDPGEKGDINVEDAVTLSTIHGAKGLEWDVVYLPQLQEGHLPSRRARLLDEERRLLYVAVTRARKHLYLSYPAGPPLFGRPGLGRPSRFITGPEVTKHLQINS